MSEWMSENDKLPPVNKEVLIKDKETGLTYIAFLDCMGDWHVECDLWMPLCEEGLKEFDGPRDPRDLFCFFDVDTPVAEYRPKWISIKDKRPQDETYIIFYDEKLGVQIGYYLSNKENPIWVYFFYGNECNDKAKDVTHWIPLPIAPK